MSNVYLVDFENVHKGGLQNASNLSKEDEIIIFYSENTSITSKGVKDALKDCKAKVTTKEVYLCGKNSLDFQLVAYLGTLVSEAEDKTFYIVSKDKDFVSVILFFREVMDVYLIPQILVDTSRNNKNNNFKLKDNKEIVMGIKHISETNLSKEEVAHIENKIYKIARLRRMEKKIVESILYSSDSLVEYRQLLMNAYKTRGNSLYKETHHLFATLKGVSPASLPLPSERLMKVVSRWEFDFADICSIIESSNSTSEYYQKLNLLFKGDGQKLYKETKELFYGVRYANF